LTRSPEPISRSRIGSTVSRHRFRHTAILRTTTYALLLNNKSLPILAQVWKAAADLADGHLTGADGEVLKQVFTEAPPIPGVPADNQATMFLALTCGDAEWSHDVAAYATRTAKDRKAWPLTAGMPVNIWPCALWKALIEKPVTVTGKGRGHILILQNRRDHATSWDSGQGLRKVLGLLIGRPPAWPDRIRPLRTDPVASARRSVHDFASGRSPCRPATWPPSCSAICCGKGCAVAES
jgi:hypothetical protein